MKKIALPLLVCTVVSGCDLAPKPQSTSILTLTPEAVTLIQEGEDLCAKVAKAGGERMRAAEEEQRRAREEALAAASQSGDPDAARKIPSADDPSQATLDRYLSDEAAADLAAADRAGSLARDLLPKVKDEAPGEVHKAVQALFASEQQVCSRVRHPKPSRLGYQDTVDAAVRDYEDATTKLAAVYTVSATDAQYARNKYDERLEAARKRVDSRASASATALTPEELERQRRAWQSAQEEQRQLQARHDDEVLRWRQRQETKAAPVERVGAAAALPEKRAQTPTMEAWYAQYTGKVAPVRAALSSYMSLRRGSFDKLQPACQQLLSATSSLVSDPQSFNLPDAGAGRILKKAYTDLQECARACVNGMDAEAAYRLAAYEGGISQAATALQSYGMNP